MTPAAIVNGREDNRVVGRPFEIRFRHTARRLFPELENYPHVLRPSGKMDIEADPRELNLPWTLEAPASHLAFLDRSDLPIPPSVHPFCPAEARRSWKNRSVSVTILFALQQRRTLDTLLKLPTVRLRYSDLAGGEQALRSLLVCNSSVKYAARRNSQSAPQRRGDPGTSKHHRRAVAQAASAHGPFATHAPLRCALPRRICPHGFVSASKVTWQTMPSGTARIAETYQTVAAALARSGIEFLVLKGFSHCPFYCDDLRHRPQYDLDLYCPPDAIGRAYDAIIGLGYEPFGRTGRTAIDHLPPLIRKTGWRAADDYYDPGMPITIELHFRFWDRATERLRVSGADRFWERRQSRAVDSLRFPCSIQSTNSPMRPGTWSGIWSAAMLARITCMSWRVFSIAPRLTTPSGGIGGTRGQHRWWKPSRSAWRRNGSDPR